MHPSTVTRDVQRLTGSGGERVCSECERPMSAKGWYELEVRECRRAYSVLAAARV